MILPSLSRMVLGRGALLLSCRHAPSAARNASTSFGYEQVDEREKAARVKTVFANVATNYDQMNDAMSFFIHRLWKDYFVRRLGVRRDTSVIDVAGGTGDIAFRILKAMQRQPQGSGSVTVVDINENMIEVGKLRADDDKSLDASRLKWLCEDAEHLSLQDNYFDLYTIAFGIRNCTHIDKVLSEAYRVLKPGGRFACLEFSAVDSALKPLYDLYSFKVIPNMGQLIAGDYNSYKYLVESIRVFPDQETFGEMIKQAGFNNVTYENLTFGVCSIHMGSKQK